MSKYIRTIGYALSSIFLTAGLILFTGIELYYLGAAFVFFGLLSAFYLLCSQFLEVRFVRSLCASITIIFVLGFSYFLIVEGEIIRESLSESDGADYVIVLGAQVYGDEPSPALQDRIERAYTYLSSNQHCVAILTGGNETGQLITEAECMFQELTTMGISSDRLILETCATSTEENLLYARELIPSEDTVVAVLTSDYHVHRAKYLAIFFGMDLVGIAAPTSDTLSCVNFFIREAFGMTYYYVFGVEAVNE